jgi:hypothetical protein
MAIHDIKQIEVRGKTVTVTGEKIAAQRYVFSGILGNIVRQVNVGVGDDAGNIAGNDPVNLQKGIDQARQMVAEQVVAIVEHNEFVSAIE